MLVQQIRPLKDSLIIYPPVQYLYLWLSEKCLHNGSQWSSLLFINRHFSKYLQQESFIIKQTLVPVWIHEKVSASGIREENSITYLHWGICGLRGEKLKNSASSWRNKREIRTPQYTSVTDLRLHEGIFQLLASSVDSRQLQTKAIMNLFAVIQCSEWYYTALLHKKDGDKSTV